MIWKQWVERGWIVLKTRLNKPRNNDEVVGVDTGLVNNGVGKYRPCPIARERWAARRLKRSSGDPKS